jgi:uncharacterized protein (DUF58 family)
MSSFRVLAATLLLRTYAAMALVVAAVFSPAVLSVAPILLLVWHLFLWWRPLNPVLRLLTDFFLFFAIALSLTTRLGPFISLPISLPMLALVTLDLQETAASPMLVDSRFRRSPTRIGVALPAIAILALGVSWLLGSLSLVLASAVAMAWFGLLMAFILRRLPTKPVEESLVQQRMVAGTRNEVEMRLTSKTAIGGVVLLESPHPWLKISPNSLMLREKTLVAKMFLTPPLSGPSLIRIDGKATDRWGLIQVRFDLQPVQLQVVPRARYAAWLARKYLAETRPGNLPLVSNVAALKPLYGLRRGVEYYGSHPYEPGDSMKNIDWKHSGVYREIIVKGFAEFHGQPAVVLINLAVGNAEEADQIAYKIIVTALSLAGEGIPVALAAYDHKGVKLTTALLEPRQLVLESLRIAMETVSVTNPERYLHPPNVARLRANVERVRSGKSEACRILAQLLQIEYRNLTTSARRNPATSALQSALAKADRQSNIVVISERNHDAEALAFDTFSYTRKGNMVISV